MGKEEIIDNKIFESYFTVFYKKIIELKDRIKTGDWLVTDQNKAPNRHEIIKGMQDIKKELFHMLDRQKSEINKLGSDILTEFF